MGDPDKEQDARHALYQAALDADDHFQRALVKEYGSRACDMRYFPRGQTPAIKELGKAKVAADTAWLDFIRNSRAEGQKGRGA
jgi:hypothetical protein